MTPEQRRTPGPQATLPDRLPCRHAPTALLSAPLAVTLAVTLTITLVMSGATGASAATQDDAHPRNAHTLNAHPRNGEQAEAEPDRVEQVRWRRTVLWIPSGPWRSDTTHGACQDGVTEESDHAGAGETDLQQAEQRWCAQRLVRHVRPAHVGVWTHAAPDDDAQHPTTTPPHRPQQTHQEAPGALAVRLARTRTIGSVTLLLSDKQMLVHDPDGHLLAVRPISAGKPSTPTPPGTFTVQSRSRRSVALVDRRIQLEHMVRFNGSIGFHGIPYLNTPAGRSRLDTPLGEANVSLGCVRLDDLDAAWLYAHLPDGARVTVMR